VPDANGAFRCARRANCSNAVNRDVLQVDGERQQPVQEGWVIGGSSSLMPVGIHQLQAGRVLEHLKRATPPPLPRTEQMIELTQRVGGRNGFSRLSSGTEQGPGPPGLALALG